MDFGSITLKTPHKQRIVIEIDILGDNVDLDKYQKIADRITNLLCQEAWLGDTPAKLTFNTKVSLQLLPQKTHEQVQLPCTKNERVINAIAQRK